MASVMAVGAPLRTAGLRRWASVVVAGASLRLMGQGEGFRPDHKLAPSRLQSVMASLPVLSTLWAIEWADEEEIGLPQHPIPSELGQEGSSSSTSGSATEDMHLAAMHHGLCVFGLVALPLCFALAVCSSRSGRPSLGTLGRGLDRMRWIAIASVALQSATIFMFWSHSGDKGSNWMAQLVYLISLVGCVRVSNSQLIDLYSFDAHFPLTYSPDSPSS